MTDNAVQYLDVLAQNCRNLRANVHPRLEVVVEVPKEEARTNAVLSVHPYVDLQALKTLLET